MDGWMFVVVVGLGSAMACDGSTEDAAAAACNPAAGADTCIISDTVTDTCGCAIAVNSGSPALDDLQQAYDAFIDEQCGPWPCGSPCPVGPEASCVLTGDGETGVCTFSDG